MNEETKHIESCRAEDPLAQTMEACGNESDLQAALQPLLVETMQGYEPVPTTAPTSPIAELPNVLISIIRRVATKPLTILGERPAKQSLLGSLVTTWNAIRNRLSGNPSLGIPDRRADMTAHSLPAALALLNDRKISGVPDAPDGISLVHLLCGSDSSTNLITKITDNTSGWIYNNTNFIASLINRFQNLEEVVLGCKSVTTQIAEMGSNRAVKFVFTDCESIILDGMIGQQSPVGGAIPGFPNGEVHFYGLKTTNQTDNTSPSVVIGKAYFHDYEKGVWLVNGSGTWSIQPMFYIYIGCKGKKTDTIRFWASEYAVNGSVKDVEIREGACQNLTLQNLNGLTAENMYNHILCRLKADEPLCGSGVTITLGTTNIEKLEAVEEYNTKLTELEDTYGYTFA